MTDVTRDDPGDPALLERIKETIRSRGRITFAEFMRMALYEPGLGYYMTAPDRFHGTDGTGQSVGLSRSGREGDYFTAPELHPLFGQMVGRQVIEMIDRLQRAAPLDEITVIEMGAGRGLMAEDILTVCASSKTVRPPRLRYVVVEVSPSLEAEQRVRLARFSEQGIAVQWCRTLDELGEAAVAPELVAIVVTNELVDAFPVHRVVMQGGRILEGYVALDGERLVEQLDLPSTPALEEYFKRLAVCLPEGFRTEVNLNSLDWMTRIGRLLRAGFVLTIDYGHAAEERYVSARRDGTLACYAGHRRLDDPLMRVGRQDLTAHIDFSALVRAGRAAGLEVAGFTDQTAFLLGLGVAEAMEERLAACDTIQREVDLTAMKMLLAPDGMGRAFKVLVQRKGLPPSPLSGLTFRPLVMPESFA
jgi:SAM-dependent MidA family methyltransferase